MRIDLNADVAESFGRWRLGDDLALLPFLTSANVACGFHAGDARTIRDTVQACARLGVGGARGPRARRRRDRRVPPSSPSSRRRDSTRSRRSAPASGCGSVGGRDAAPAERGAPGEAGRPEPVSLGHHGRHR
ncbi:MAG TPA: LamB/YcsF family protein [Kineosporiaceae bacterium]|nr:LamB/YcsF family protein [Kineosporiaceae bacterium]